MNCRICNKKDIYVHHKIIYCSEKCKKIGQKVKNKIIEDRKKYIFFKTCKRCQKKFKPLYKFNEKYCKYCIEIITKEDISNIKSNIKQGDKMKTHCERCEEKFDGPVLYKKFCEKCVLIKQKEKMQRAKDKRKKDKVKNKKIKQEMKEQENKDISKWTSRGEIRTTGTK